MPTKAKRAKFRVGQKVTNIWHVERGVMRIRRIIKDSTFDGGYAVVFHGIPNRTMKSSITSVRPLTRREAGKERHAG